MITEADLQQVKKYVFGENKDERYIKLHLDRVNELKRDIPYLLLLDFCSSENYKEKYKEWL